MLLHGSLEKVLFSRFVEQGCQIGYFMANFEKIGHFLTALAMTKRIWPICKIWPFFRFVTVKLSFH